MVASISTTVKPATVWSEYQIPIFDFITDGEGCLLINALAGTGKSSTLKEAARRLSFARQCNAIYLAFNSHIVESIKGELPRVMGCSTIHAEGRRALASWCATQVENFSQKAWILDGSKYKKLVKYYYATEWPTTEETTEWKEEIKSVVKLVRFTMLTLTDADNADKVRALAASQNIVLTDDGWFRALRCIPTVLRRGIIGNPTADAKGLTYKITQVYSYDDMIYAPCVLDVTIPQYGDIFIDECQDLNRCQQRIVELMGGRAYYCGDRNQAIYHFAGADTHSFDSIAARRSAIILPLNRCYRCPTSHIELAKRLVPALEAAPGAKEGIIEDVHPDDLADYVKEGDLILCRTIAPMTVACYGLIAKGIKAVVKGVEIGAGLKDIVESVTLLNSYKTHKNAWTAFLTSLDEYLTINVIMLSQGEDTEMAIEKIADECACIAAIYSANYSRLSGPDALCAEIDSLFVAGDGQVTFSSIHKSKGLEAERVGILKYDLLPHPKATTPAELEQELHLEYVALTRSKDTLFFITETAERREVEVFDPYAKWDKVPQAAIDYYRLAPGNWYYVNGDAFLVKDRLKTELNARFDFDGRRRWMVSEDGIITAQRIID